MILTTVMAGLLSLSALQPSEAHLVLSRPAPRRERREVGPVLRKEKKYRRLQHSIMIQADIRSRSVNISYRLESRD